MKTTIKSSLLTALCVLLANCTNAPKNTLEDKVLTLSLKDSKIGNHYANCLKNVNEGYFSTMDKCLINKGVKL